MVMASSCGHTHCSFLATVISTSASRTDAGVPVLLVKGTATTNVFDIDKGDAALAWYAGEATGLGTLNVGYTTNQQSDSTVWCGPDVTFTNCAVIQSGGSLTLNSSITSTGTVVCYGGTLTVNLAAAVNQLTAIDATVIYNSTGTLGGNTVLSGSATLDFSQDLRAKTVTNAIQVFSSKVTVNDPNKVVGSLVLALKNIPVTGNLSIGSGMTLTRS